MSSRYDWGYHSSDAGHVHVVFIDEGDRDEQFDVALYDPEEIDIATGINAQDQSLADLRRLLGYANAAIEAGLEPLPVADKIEAD